MLSGVAAQKEVQNIPYIDGGAGKHDSYYNYKLFRLIVQFIIINNKKYSNSVLNPTICKTGQILFVGEDMTTYYALFASFATCGRDVLRSLTFFFNG